MATRGSQPFVQTSFTDQPGIGYAGYIESYQDRVVNNRITQFWTPDELLCGTGVVKGQVQNFDNADSSIRQPYTVITPSFDSTDPLTEDDFVGVVFRREFGVFPVEGTDGNFTGYRARRVVPIVPKNLGVGVFVDQRPTIGDVTSGDPVYMVTTILARFTSGNLDYNLLPGQFVNVAAQTDGHTILIPNAYWKYTRNGGGSSNRFLDPINTIIFA